MDEEIAQEENEVGIVATRGIQLSWSNIRNGEIRLFPRSYDKFPIMPLSNFLVMWYCGDRPNRIPPYRILSYKDVRHMKNGK